MSANKSIHPFVIAMGAVFLLTFLGNMCSSSPTERAEKEQKHRNAALNSAIEKALKGIPLSASEERVIREMEDERIRTESEKIERKYYGK